MTTTDNGVEYLQHKLEAARQQVVRGSHGSLSAADDLICEALDVLTGSCRQGLKVVPAPQSISWFAVTVTDGAMVVEHMPDRDRPYHSVMWTDNVQTAELVAKLLTDNERSASPRREILRGERLSADAPQAG